ncbi:MAG: aspartate--tRNA ligase [Clostridia bacterium]|jgi:aspartyl-tRNA synthetase|nr:aspartate--tRNA ligase [Clostridia bacterium]
MNTSMEGLSRSHGCGDLRMTHLGETVTLMGWVSKRRDHGGLIFVDLRDRSGKVQIVFSPEISKEAFHLAESVRGEYVLAVSGEVRQRPEGTENPALPTGEVEVEVRSLTVLNQAKTPPFYITENVDVDENLRLRYRYLDLRRPDMQEGLILRHRVTKTIRDFLDERGFLEIETPMLTKSTPEGARDYLVPSRVHPGEFFALPQSPQLYKQLLMVSGFEKYFQFARCFRDEDLRADRQPEFTQLDMEMSFINREDIIQLVEDMFCHLFRQVMGIELPQPFPRLSYAKAMDKYGSDKPDLRFDLELKDVTDLVKDSGFKVFASVCAAGGQVKGLRVPGCAHYSRKELDDLTKFAGIYGAKGLAWMILAPEGLKSPISKFFTEEEIDAIINRLEAETGDLLLFVADKPQVVAQALGALRVEFGKRLNLIDPEEFNFAWVIDFPLLEYDEDEKRYVAIHHPFTSAKEEDLPLLATEPLKARAQAYDLILNGVEVGGGSIRIHNRQNQEQLFSLLGFSQAEAQEKFGFLLEAFEYGTPPHGGIAFGLDRLVMLMAGKDTIRDVMAFPKTQSASDLMTKAPSPVAEQQLKELKLRVDEKKTAVAQGED